MGLPRIPPYYRRKGYQRFFGGLIIGFIGGWVFFLLNSGSLIDEYIIQIKEQQIKINALKDENNVLSEDKLKLNEENQKKLLVEEITVQITETNQTDKIDRLTKLNLVNAIKAELKIVLQKDVESVAANRDLLMQLLKNKEFKIDDNNYRITDIEMNLYTTLELYVKVIQVK
jgi:hypothetical protein